MNKTEYWNIAYRDRNNECYTRVQKLLKDWKVENDITERCAVHHRDDTEETRKYNAEHYERWGFNEDGTFEYGKYVIFMTSAEHKHYHNMVKHPWLGKKHTEATKKKMSMSHIGIRPSVESKEKNHIAHIGRTHTTATKAKMQISHKQLMEKTLAIYKQYKKGGGELSWNDFQRALKNNEINIE